MDRRQFLIFASALAYQTRTANAFTSTCTVTTQPLWCGLPPGDGGPRGMPKISSRGAVSHIAVPTLTVLKPDKPNGHAVLVAAGGGYRRIEMAKEAWPAALWLRLRGYTPYILRYRLPGEEWNAGNLVSLQDARRALRIIRARHHKLTVLGFSAGGHLLGMAAARADYDAYPAQDAIDSMPAYADGVALIYPVVTLEAPWTHTSTHRQLVGDDASARAEAQWSVQHFITPQAPSFFYVQARDDKIAAPHNALLLKAACCRAHVPIELHCYSRGGHGFSMGRAGTPTMAWPERYAAWLNRQ